MSKRLLLLNLIVVSAGVVFSVQLARSFLSSPQLPPPPPTRPAQAAPLPTTEESPRAPGPLAQYDVVASKNLFNPNRSEAGAASAAPVAKPLLYGIVLKDGAPAAFLEDPTTKKVASYKVGDAVAGGQLEQIEADRVVIRRGESTFEVLLRDPSKPKAVAGSPPAAPGQPGASPPRPQLPGAPTVQAPPTPAAPQPGSPTLFRRPQSPAVPPARNAPDS